MKCRLTALTRLNPGKWMRTSLALCATIVLALATQTPADAQTLTTLHSFKGSGPQGLVQAADGDLWGTLYGISIFGSTVGGVFKIDPDNGATATHRLDAINASAPLAGLVLATDGNFYGTASGGGAYNGGAIFKLTPNGVLTTVYNFCAHSVSCFDGREPTTLFQGANGNLYGITQFGGGGDQGTIFTITLGGTLTGLYSFCAQASCADGGMPEGLVQGADGNFYGTTRQGGAQGEGTVFQLTPSRVFTTLHTFCAESACTDGNAPEAGLVQGVDGNFYGTTVRGGTSNEGTIFKITSVGALTTLHSFDGTDGAEPLATLIQATDGNFYGTTFTSGPGFSTDPGTVFQITPSGALTTLYTFCSQSDCADGLTPQAPLVQYTDGTFYGTTGESGFSAKDCGSSPNFGCGTVFRLATGLGPFVADPPHLSQRRRPSKDTRNQFNRRYQR